MGISHRDAHPQLWMTMGRVVSEKSNRITRRFEWTPRLEKFSEKSWRAFSSRNRTWRGVGSEEDALEQRGFWDKADLCLSAMCRLSERETPSHQVLKYKEERGNVCMKNAWTCDMKKKFASWVQPNPNLSTHNFQHINTHLDARNIVKMHMECNAWSYNIK